MKIAARRPRSDSATAAIAAAQAVALGPLPAPDHVALRPGDLPYWKAIMTARARDTWTTIDLCTAGNLARTQHDIEHLTKKLELEGYITPDGKVSPVATLVDTLSRRALSLARALHVHAECTVGAVKDAGKQLANERNAAKSEDDDLIPTLNRVK